MVIALLLAVIFLMWLLAMLVVQHGERELQHEERERQNGERDRKIHELIEVVVQHFLEQRR